MAPYRLTLYFDFAHSDASSIFGISESLAVKSENSIVTSSGFTDLPRVIRNSLSVPGLVITETH